MGARPDCPEFTAATLPPPLQWEGRSIWRADLKVYQYSNGVDWLTNTYQDPTTGALVGAGGEVLARIDLHQGADDIPGAVAVQTTSTAALSTTAMIRFTPAGGSYRVARLTWTNNGGPGNGVAYVVANCDNDARGLFASQQAQQRDASISIGGAVLLRSPVPFESICVSADQAYSSGQHALTCIFGA